MRRDDLFAGFKLHGETWPRVDFVRYNGRWAKMPRAVLARRWLLIEPNKFIASLEVAGSSPSKIAT
jgi:hypothetical protein